MKKNSLTLSLPEWIDDFLKQYQFPLVSNEERMRFVLKLTLQNIEKTTGGPFGAAVFERESGQLVSVGVNVVLKQGCSAAHAEMMAIMLAQQELGTHDLGIAELPEFQLVTSGKMCAMCLGSVVWSGVREVLASAQPEDVENIVGFDEGPAPADYDQQLEKRGISIIPSFLREEGCEVLHRYVELEGVVYNPSRNS
ncbi:MAG: nucleoside deaminase [SAR324 cluster bacterium]|nr:nucleoside deaminase [SAR324 cluster bacterium]